MNLKHAPSFIIGITLAAMLVAAVVVPTINSAELGQTYNVPTHGEEQAIYNKDFNWWVDYWQKYDCESCWIALHHIGSDYFFKIVEYKSWPGVWEYYDIPYDPNFDMSYDSAGTWIIQFNSTDGVAIGDNILVSTNAPTKEYAREVAYNSDRTITRISGWYEVSDNNLNSWVTSKYDQYQLEVNSGIDIGHGYYSFVKNDIDENGNKAEFFFKVTDIGQITIGGDPTIRTLLFIIPVLMLAGLVITVAMSLRIKRD